MRPPFIQPGALLNPSMKSWLGGIEPAWRLLDHASLRALRRPPSPSEGPFRLASDLTPPEIQQSAVARNALVLLNAAEARNGLKLTATGNLSRAVVAEMIGRFTWPDFDWEDHAWVHKVVNELDFQPLYVVHHIAGAARLLRKYKGQLKVTSAGRRFLDGPHQPALQAVLFHVALWYLDMWPFVDSLGGWPQYDVGIVLWSLSVAANDWQPPDRLTRLCTIPIDSVLESQWDTGTWVMEARILRPLLWFGLLELRRDEDPENRIAGRQFYRKTALFDRFLSFDVKHETAEGPRH
jgi:hypothetical protein